MYEHKPEQINTVQDMIDFLEPIPPSVWCVDRRNDRLNRHCVLGHLDEAYGCDVVELAYAIGTTVNKLACANNGTLESWCDPRPAGTRTDGFAIRKRVLSYLKSLL